MSEFRKGRAIILFADVVGASELSEHTTLEGYAESIVEFHDRAEELRTKIWESVQSRASYDSSTDRIGVDCAGDEVALLSARLPSQGETEPLSHSVYNDWAADNVLGAVRFALALKASWLLSTRNIQERILRDRLPIDLAVGIHAGPIALTKPMDSGDLKFKDFVGYDINVCKRIEGQARDAKWTGVMLSSQVRRIVDKMLPCVLIENHPPRELKGVFRPLRIAEIREVIWFSRFFEFLDRPIVVDPLHRPKLYQALSELVECNHDNGGLREMAAIALALMGDNVGAQAIANRFLIHSLIADADDQCTQTNYGQARRQLMKAEEFLGGNPLFEKWLHEATRNLEEKLKAIGHPTPVEDRSMFRAMAAKYDVYFDESGNLHRGAAPAEHA